MALCSGFNGKTVSWGTLLWRDLTIINVLAASVIYLLILSCARNNFPKRWYVLGDIDLVTFFTQIICGTQAFHNIWQCFIFCHYQVLKTKCGVYWLRFYMHFFWLISYSKTKYCSSHVIVYVTIFHIGSTYRKVVPFILLGTLSGLILTGVFLSQSLDLSFIFILLSWRQKLNGQCIMRWRW